MMRISILLCLLSMPLRAQTVFHYSGAEKNLTGKLTWAQQEGGSTTYWAGYRIDALMGRRAFYGSFRGARIEKVHSLYALIGEPEKYDALLSNVHLGWHFNGQGTIQLNDDDHEGPHDLMLKEIGILMLFDAGVPVWVKAGNMSMEFELDGHNLYWLNHVDQAESIAQLKDIYNKIRDDDEKEDLITLLGMHGTHPDIEQFVTGVLQGDQHPDIRERAAFVIGKQNTKTALNTLHKSIRNDSSEDVREHAVYAVSQMSLPDAQDLLIDLAKNEGDKEIRKKAIYGLGQKASRKALELLEETVHDEIDADVQKHAVYALAQFDPDTALPRLIDIAKNHSHPKVRKSAIYMLGNIGNDQAVDALIELVERP